MPTTAEIVRDWQSGRDLFNEGLIDVVEQPHNAKTAFVAYFMPDGRPIDVAGLTIKDSDHIQARHFSTLKALADSQRLDLAEMPHADRQVEDAEWHLFGLSMGFDDWGLSNA